MSDAARAKQMAQDIVVRKLSALDLSAGPNTQEFAAEIIAAGLVAYAAEQTAQKDAEIERWKLKAEQYQRQLDDRWAGVTTMVNDSVEQTAQATRERDIIIANQGQELTLEIDQREMETKRADSLQ